MIQMNICIRKYLNIFEYPNISHTLVGITFLDPAMLYSQLEQIGNLNFNLGRLAGLGQFHSSTYLDL